MIEFKIGDRVKVRTNLIVDNTYGYDNRCYFADGMEKYKGKIYIIENIEREDRYTLNLEDRDYWEFTHDMLELVDSSELDSESLLEVALKLLEMDKSELMVIFEKSNKREKELNNLKHEIHSEFEKRDCGIACDSCEYGKYTHCEIAFTIDELAKKDLLNLE